MKQSNAMAHIVGWFAVTAMTLLVVIHLCNPFR
jgi:hypothetical protein